jgi:hypothetical protein
MTYGSFCKFNEAMGIVATIPRARPKSYTRATRDSEETHSEF